MRVSPLFPLLVSLVLLGAGCSWFPNHSQTNTSSTTTVESHATTVPTDSVKPTSEVYSITDFTVKRLPQFSDQSQLQVIRLNDRLNARLYDPTDKQEVSSYGSAETSLDFRFPFYDLQGNKLGDLHATETAPGVYQAQYTDANGATVPVELDRAGQPPLFTVASLHKSALLPNTSDNPCEFEASYPQLTAATGLDASLLAKINTEIASSSRPMTVADEVKSNNLEDSADHYLDACKESAKELMAFDASSSEDFGPPPGWYFSQSFDVPLFDLDRGLLSIMLVSEEYSGGAHGNHFFSFINFDLKTGKRLKMGDLIATNKLKPFFQQEKRRLIQTNEENAMLFDENLEDFQTFVENRGPQTAAETKEFANFDSFYLTRAGLTTLYNEYEIAPYAAGPQSVDLDYGSIKQYFASDSVLLRMIP